MLSDVVAFAELTGLMRN